MRWCVRWVEASMWAARDKRLLVGELGLGRCWAWSLPWSWSRVLVLGADLLAPVAAAVLAAVVAGAALALALALVLALVLLELVPVLVLVLMVALVLVGAGACGYRWR